MEEIKPGKNTFSYQNNLSMPPGFDVIKIYPDELTIAMEEKKTKPIPVELQWTGALPEGKKLFHTKSAGHV